MAGGGVSFTEEMWRSGVWDPWVAGPVAWEGRCPWRQSGTRNKR